MKFSVIVPTCNRYRRLDRALHSLDIQTFRNFETVVVDDGSKNEQYVRKICNKWKFEGLELIRHDVNQGRVIARNTGMEVANGEWICWLDSDDAWDIEYLNTFAYNIEQNPEVKLWVCGAVVHGMHKEETGLAIVPRYTKLRHAWKPPMNPTPPPIHSHFTSGKVGTGMFVFHRECLEKTGLLPPWRNHLHIADGVDDWLGYETGYSAAKKWVGNPYGDDWAFHRKLTMFYESHLIEACLYTHYVR